MSFSIDFNPLCVNVSKLDLSTEPPFPKKPRLSASATDAAAMPVFDTLPPPHPEGISETVAADGLKKRSRSLSSEAARPISQSSSPILSQVSRPVSFNSPNRAFSILSETPSDQSLLQLNNSPE